MREPKRPGHARAEDEDVTEVPGSSQPAAAEPTTAPSWSAPPEPVPLWESLEVPVQPKGKPAATAATAATRGAPRAPEPQRLVPTPGQVLARRYTVLEVLGQGGMGLVVAAFDSKLDRRVALKLLSPEYSGEAASTRLLREAQAMARLNHPNVVQVYDTGRLQDRSLFIAMEYVQGQTLRRWCHEDPGSRSWREVLQAYVAAGRGLAAAHAAGVIHRDFKPDNVLVGHDGRVKVTDFGLARAEQEPAEPTAVLSPDTSMPLAAWELQLTRPGIVMGTPRYMAPELTRGQPADERSDVFAFCVSLYEALYQQMAFPGERQAERMQAHAEGRVNPPPANTPVPAQVTRAVLQGLRADPLQRPPSMESLLRVLEYDPVVRRRARLQAVAVAGVVAALGGLALLGWLRRPGAVCEGMEGRLAGVWDEPTQQQMRQAFLGTGLPYAEDTWWRVAGPLQSYASAWVERRAAACRASQGTTGQPRDLALLEVDCLERRRSQLAALSELLARGMDQELLSKAVQATRALPTLESCADVRTLVTAVPLPQEPALRKRVEELLAQVDRLEALEAAGKYRQGLELSRALLPQVQQVEYAPVRARALYLAALLSFGDGDYNGAESLVRQVLPVAAQAADDELLAHAWSLLVRAVGGKQSRHAEALGMQLALETAVERSKSDLARASALNSLGSVLADMGRFEESREHYERALTLSEKALGPEHLLVAAALGNLGNMLREMGRYEQALKLHERALAVREKVLGPEHPLVANSQGNVANGLRGLSRREEALALYERTLATQERTLGPNHPYVATTLNNLGALLKEMGRYTEALQHHERALARIEQVLGPEHRDLVVALNNMGEALASLGRYEEARTRYERALAVGEKALGPEHPLVAHVLDNQGTLMLRLGLYEEARWNYERAMALRRKALGPEHPEVGYTLSNQGNLAFELEQCREASQLQDRASALFERALGPKHPSLATALGRLGRAQVCAGELEPAGHHLERARALLEHALGPHHLELYEPLLGLGELELARGHPEESLPHLERALELAPPADRPEVQLALARALQTTRTGRPRARELATQALEHYQRVGNRKRATEASRWLAAQGAR